MNFNKTTVKLPLCMIPFGTITQTFTHLWISGITCITTYPKSRQQSGVPENYVFLVFVHTYRRLFLFNQYLASCDFMPQSFFCLSSSFHHLTSNSVGGGGTGGKGDTKFLRF